MTQRMKNFLRGAGSLIVLYPGPNTYERLVPKAPAEKRLAETWLRVGDHIRYGIKVVSSEPPQQKEGD